jgi:pimeloyl-ACP methyl ester carboxylesterase
MTPLEDPGPGFRERRFTAKDGLELTFRDYGDPLSKACPLLCLAGLTRNSKDFAEVAKRQAGARRVIALDYRGRGRSAYDPDWHHYRPEVYLDDVLQLVAATNLHRPVVCGTSLGGLLAMGLAVATPCLLAGVILNDVGPDIPAGAIGGILAMLAVARPQSDWTEAVAHLQKSLPNLSFSGRSSWESFAKASYRRGEDGRLHPDWDPAILRPLQSDGGRTPDLWRYFRALRSIPTLAVRGALSDLLTEACLARMAEEKPDLQQVTVTETGHAPTLDEPEAEAALDEFLNTCDSGRI